jgi:hypothetical protein
LTRHTAVGALSLFCVACAHTSAGAPAQSSPTATGSRTVAAGSSPSPAQQTAEWVLCMREHGVPVPSPRRSGSIRLTARQEARLTAIPQTTRMRAKKACARFIPAIDRIPLSKHAQRQALRVLGALVSCMKAHGFHVGRPEVTANADGTAFFGFDGLGGVKPSRAMSRALPRDAPRRRRGASCG